MIDPYDVDDVLLLVDPVDDAVRTAPSRSVPL